MSYYASYLQEVRAVIDPETWSRAWTMLLSYRGRLQPVTGYREMRVATSALPGDRLEVGVETTWNSLEALEVWAERGELERLFLSLDPEPESVEARVRRVAI